MIKKFNWGHGIALFYIVFVTVVIWVLIASFDVDHSLVVEEYYEADMAYQSTYDKMSNALQNKEIEIVQDKKYITVNFGENHDVTGEIRFYRPSDKSKDFTHKITQNKEQILLVELLKGKWKLQIDWSVNSQSFYKEESIFI